MDIQSFNEDLCIQSTFWVDDDHAKVADLNIEHLLSAFVTELFSANSTLRKQVRTLFINSFQTMELKKSVGIAFRHLPTDENDGDEDEFERLISDLLNHADDALGLIKVSLSVADGGITNSNSSEAINNYMSTGGSFEKLSFTEWLESHQARLDDIDGESKYLILLDLHNTKESDLNNDIGKEILANLANHEKANHLLILVLTSRCTASEEFKFGKELSDNHCTGTPVSIFAVSKARDWESGTEEIFKEVFLRTALVDSYSKLKLELTNEYKKSIDSIFDKLRPITIEEVVQGVAVKSESEGISEVKSLLRIINHQTKRSFDENVKDNNELLNLIFRCRKLDASLIPREEVDRSALEEFHLSENYENIEAVNALHDQITVGDIFNINEEPDKIDLFILIGNVCNTSLRGDSGARKDQVALVFPLGSHPGHDNSVKVGSSAGMILTGVVEEKDLYVDFTRPTTFDYGCLDLCWTNKDGVANFNFENGDEGFKSDNLEDLFQSGFLTRAQRERMKKIAESPPTTSTNIRRVGRVSRDFATSILHCYSRGLSSIPSDVIF